MKFLCFATDLTITFQTNSPQNTRSPTTIDAYTTTYIAPSSRMPDPPTGTRRNKKKLSVNCQHQSSVAECG